MLCFSDIQLKNCRDLANRTRGLLTSLEMSPFDRAHATSYLYSIVTGALIYTVSQKNPCERLRR